MKNFLKDESGQAVTEYVLIITLLAVAAAATIASMGSELGNIYGKIENEVSKAAG